MPSTRYLQSSHAHAFLIGLPIYALRAIGVYGLGEFCLDFFKKIYIELGSLSTVMLRK